MVNEVTWSNYEDVRRFLIGKKVKLIKEIGEDINIEGIYINGTMARNSGKIMTINNLELHGGTPVFYLKEDRGDYMYPLSLAEEFYEEKKEEDASVKIKKGDLITGKILKVTKGTKNETYLGKPLKIISNGNEKIVDKKIIVLDILENNVIIPYFVDGEYVQEPIEVSQVKVLKENYLEKITSKKAKTKEEKKIIEDIDLITEMKEKVNVKDFKKIYAGAMLRIPNELKGVELVLNQWAFNKRHLYKMLGNKLSISKEIEYSKDVYAIRQDRQNIYRSYPGTYYVVKAITDEELLDNKLHHTISNDWCVYSRRYKSGEKVSKLLDEAFHNDKLNILYSDIIAQNKIKGTVEISIDPIEILLMSCNVSGWNSCHRIALVNEEGLNYGCYSAGIFSYMCDETSMIAFRHDGKTYDYKINKQKVQARSKNWRQMIWINKDLNKFITSRQYPNKIEEVTKTVRELLEEQIDSKEQSEKNWVHSDKQDKIRQILEDRKDVSSPLHYNDMLRGYNGDLCYKKGLKIKDNEIMVGANPVCPNCGKRLLTNPGTPECIECSRER